MRHIAPPVAVAIGDLDRVTEHRVLALGPQVAETFDAQFAFGAASGVHRVLEAVHRDLAEHRGDRVLQRGRQQGEAFVGVVDQRQQSITGDRFAEHRRRLGERERRVLVEDALFAGQVEMDAMSEFVGERCHVARLRRPVQQHVRVMLRRHAGGERAAALAGANRGVDPRFVDEPSDDSGELRRERGVCVAHDLCSLGPANVSVGAGHRRHAVVVGELVEAEHLGLQRVPASGDRVVVDHGVDKCLDRLVGGLVGEVA